MTPKALLNRLSGLKMNAQEAYDRHLGDTGDKVLEAKIEKTAVRMAKARERGDISRYLALREKLAILSLSYFKVHGGNATEGVDEILLDTIVKYLDEYDPKRGEFIHVVRNNYKFRCLDEGEKQQKIAEHERSIYREDDEREFQEKDICDEKAAADSSLEKTYVQAAEEKASAALLELLALISAFVSRTDDARLEKRRRYTPLFFTKTAVRMTKDQLGEDTLGPIIRHEKGVFSAMEVPFLDTFMADICRKIVEIWRSGFKDGVLFQNRIADAQAGKAKYVAWTLPARFYKDYCKDVWDDEVSDAAISQQRKAYERLLEQLR